MWLLQTSEKTRDVHHGKYHIPVLGLIENMAYFTPKTAGQQILHFGKQGAHILQKIWEFRFWVKFR
jgi:Mrp family chromosome partitioning ATPase